MRSVGCRDNCHQSAKSLIFPYPISLPQYNLGSQNGMIWVGIGMHIAKTPIYLTCHMLTSHFFMHCVIAIHQCTDRWTDMMLIAEARHAIYVTLKLPMCAHIIVHNCHTQYSTTPILHTVITVKIRVQTPGLIPIKSGVLGG